MVRQLSHNLNDYNILSNYVLNVLLHYALLVEAKQVDFRRQFESLRGFKKKEFGLIENNQI